MLKYCDAFDRSFAILQQCSGIHNVIETILPHVGHTFHLSVVSDQFIFSSHPTDTLVVISQPALITNCNNCRSVRCWLRARSQHSLELYNGRQGLAPSITWPGSAYRKAQPSSPSRGQKSAAPRLQSPAHASSQDIQKI